MMRAGVYAAWVATCAADLAPGDWPMWGQNALYSSFKDVNASAAAGRAEWSFTAGDRVVSSPAVALGRVWFGSDDGKLYCLDAKTGKQVWAWEPAAARAGAAAADDCPPNYCEHGLCACGKLRSSPAVDAEGSVYFGSYDFHVYKVDAHGKTVWDFKTDGAVYGPITLAGDDVYAGSFDGFLYALDAATGAKKWAAAVGSHGDAGWVVAGDTIFGQTNEGGLCSAWPPPDVPGYPTHSCDRSAPPGAADACGQCHALAVDRATGARAWTADTKQPGGGGAFVSDSDGEDGLYVQGDWSGDVIAYDVAGGVSIGPERWRVNIGGSVESHPAWARTEDGHVVYVSAELKSHELVALDAATGAVQWVYNDTNATLNSSPAATADAVYVGSNDHLLHAVNRTTGARLWTFETCANVFSSPAVDDEGMVYVGCNTVTGTGDAGVGALYAINPAQH